MPAPSYTDNHWHLRKELSIGTLISLGVLSIGSVSAYVTAMAQIQDNQETIIEVKESAVGVDRIVRLEERILALQEQQLELRRELAASRLENRAQEQAMTTSLQQIQVALAELKTEMKAVK